VKKAAKKKGKATGKQELNPAEVWKDISLLVEGEAAKMAQAVIDEGKKGQLAPVRYLLELAHIFPQLTDGSQSTEEEDSLAKTLLNRLNIPDVPIVLDDEDELIRIATMKTPVPVAADEHEGAGAKRENSDTEDAADGANSDEAMVVQSIP
jgi:hypothetical protein